MHILSYIKMIRPLSVRLNVINAMNGCVALGGEAMETVELREEPRKDIASQRRNRIQYDRCRYRLMFAAAFSRSKAGSLLLLFSKWRQIRHLSI